VWTEAGFEFLNDIVGPRTNFVSPFRAAVVSSFFDLLQKYMRVTVM